MALRATMMAAVMLVFCTSFPAEAVAADEEARVEPSQVSLSFFYSGQDIRATLEASGSEDVVIQATGPEQPVTLKRKGRKLGVLWMNVGEVHYKSVPVLYMVRSTKKLEEIASPEELGRLGIGCEAIHPEAEGDQEDGGVDVFQEFIKLKTSEKMYSCEGGDVARQKVGDRAEFSTEFFVPARAPIGEYSVRFLAFQNGRGHLVTSRKFELVRGSSIEFVTGMLETHGLLYGCLAVIIALLAGLGTGLIFGMRKGESH